MIAFDSIPTVGTTVSIDGQVYEVRGTEPHTKQDGSETVLLVLETLCADCGQAMVARSTLRSNGYSRRCSDCAKVGKPVIGRRGRKCKITVTHA